MNLSARSARASRRSSIIFISSEVTSNSSSYIGSVLAPTGSVSIAPSCSGSITDISTSEAVQPCTESFQSFSERLDIKSGCRYGTLSSLSISVPAEMFPPIGPALSRKDIQFIISSVFAGINSVSSFFSVPSFMPSIPETATGSTFALFCRRSHISATAPE